LNYRDILISPVFLEAISLSQIYLEVDWRGIIYLELDYLFGGGCI
jgi:hypothetical protein